MPNPWAHLVPSSGTSLVTYASLIPGTRQSERLARLEGQFFKGHIRGTFFPAGQGSSDGYPGCRLHGDGAPIPAWLFKSNDLPAQWPYLDVYEGDEYARLPCVFTYDDGRQEWSEAYVLACKHPQAQPCPFDLPGLDAPEVNAEGEHDLRLASRPDST